MKELNGITWSYLVDQFSLKLQEWHDSGQIKDNLPLFRIDYRDEAVKAPFMFDIAGSKLHRSTCQVVRSETDTPFYAVWEPSREDFRLGCQKCRPVTQKAAPMEKDKASDILFGFLSVIDQFSSVIIERGREFRKTDKGKAIAESLHSLNGLMDKTQKDSINSLSSLMDVLLVIAQTCEKEISTQSNGSSNGSNGSAKEHDDPDIKQ